MLSNYAQRSMSRDRRNCEIETPRTRLAAERETRWLEAGRTRVAKLAGVTSE